MGLLLGLVLSSGLAFFWPMLAGNDTPIDPFQLSKNGLWLLVAITMLCLGMVVQRSELVELRRSPASVFAGLLIQTCCMPLLAWLATRVLQLEGELAAGVILVGCVPGAMASNVLTMTARGNVSYSVCLTAVATLASPITVPLLLSIFAGANVGGADPLATSRTLLITVVLPILAGFTAKELWAPVRMVATRVAPILAGVALLWIIASVVAGNRDRIAQIDASVFLALAAVNIAGYSAGWSAGKLIAMPASMRRALTLEVGMQNAGVGTALAATLYGSDSLAQIPTAAYTFGCMATGTMLAAFWSAQLVKDFADTELPTSDDVR
ncbi:MAG: bile acid:sodium symporter family protein [Aureliella sp.]